ncbi:AAA+ ATPase, partial [Helicosporidium sp. ATCC 50920]
MLSSKFQSLKLETPDSTKDCMTEAGIDVDAFMLRLLRLEREAEIEACLLKEGESAGGLSGMILKDIEPGVLGRSLLTFAPKAAHLAHKLPVHSLSPNAPAAVRATAQKEEAGTEETGTIATGIVTRIGPGSISLSMDEVPAEGLDLVVSLEPVPNEAAHNRMTAAVQSLVSVVSSGSSIGAEVARLCMYQLPLAPAAPANLVGSLAAVCSAPAPAAASPAPEALEWSPISSSRLDGSQAEAVSLALGRPDLALVHGPPGTGKTTTLVEIIAQHALRGHKVLACAASNVAVDNLVERLAAVRLPGARRPLEVVRLGHPARLAPSILSHSLEAKLGEPLHAQSVRACLKEQQKLTQKLAKCSAWVGERKEGGDCFALLAPDMTPDTTLPTCAASRAQRAERTSLRSQLRGLSSEQRALQWLAVRDIVAAADVVCATLTGVDVSALRDVRFELVALDEAGQAVEPACWPALLRGRKAVLAGDHRQLPPTVLSPAAEREGLGCTLFERLM